MSKQKLESNYYHKKLESLRQKVIKDECIMSSHLYYFDCGCVRTYRIDMFTLQDSEDLNPCAKHKRLLK